jgi:hypothetical protein
VFYFVSIFSCFISFMDKSKDISCVCKTLTSRRFSPSKSYENDFERCFKIFDLTRRGKLCDTCKGCVYFVSVLLYILEHSKCVFIYEKLIINKNMVSIKYT